MKPSVGLMKRELHKPTSNKIMNYIYTVLTKAHVTKLPATAPFAQVELSSDDIAKIKVANIDINGNQISRTSKRDIEIHATIF